MTTKYKLLLFRANVLTGTRGWSSSSTRKFEIPPLDREATDSTTVVMEKKKRPKAEGENADAALGSLKKSNKKFYITDSTLSQYIPQVLGGNIVSESCAVAIMYPGPGPLAQEVLEQGAKNLFLFEPHAEFRQSYDTLQYNNESQQLCVSDGKFFRGKQGRFSPDQQISQLFKNPQFLHVKVITTVPTNAHAKQIVLDFVDGAVGDQWKNIEYFLLTNSVTAPVVDPEKPGSRRLRNYWPWHLWTFFTKTTKIATFTPSDKKTSSQDLTLYKTVYKSWPVDLRVPSFKVTEQERRLLCLFTRYCFADAGGLVVASLEKISPRIGLQLLRFIDSLNLHTKFYQLTPEEFLAVYGIFRKNNLNKTRVWQILDEDWDSHPQEE